MASGANNSKIRSAISIQNYYDLNAIQRSRLVHASSAVDDDLRLLRNHGRGECYARNKQHAPHIYRLHGRISAESVDANAWSPRRVRMLTLTQRPVRCAPILLVDSQRNAGTVPASIEWKYSGVLQIDVPRGRPDVST